MAKLTEEEKIQYTQMALGMAYIGLDKKTTETIIRMYEAVLKKKEDFSLRDAAQIITELDNKYKPQEPAPDSSEENTK